MISDVLSEAVQDFDRYLQGSYIYREEDWSPENWKLLLDCREVMVQTRVMLDTFPSQDPST
jgi:hypothetical protein